MATEEFDKDSVYDTWREQGLPEEALEGLWNMATTVREYDSEMESIMDRSEEADRAKGYTEFWANLGQNVAALSYMAEQRQLRIMAQEDMRVIDPETFRIGLMMAWLDGMATGLSMKKFDFTTFFPPIDGTNRT